MAKSKKKVEPVNRTVEILKKIQGNKDTSDLGLQMMDATKVANVPCVSSGICSLDLALGGGYPQGRVIEIYGKEGGGKTTLGLHALAAAQSRGNSTAMVDVEHAYDPAYGARLGINPSRMLTSQPDSGEQALTVVETLCDHMQHGDIILLDSVASLVPQAELDGEMGDAHVGLQARLMGQALRKLTAKVSKSGVLVIFINQLREKVGVLWGPKETTPGGRALKFYASQRIDVRRGKNLEDKDAEKNTLGQYVKIKVSKNKVAPPFREVEVRLYFGHGVLRGADLLALGVSEGVIEVSGRTYSFRGKKLEVGRKKSEHFLANNTEIMDQIETAIKAKYSAAG